MSSHISWFVSLLLSHVSLLCRSISTLIDCLKQKHKNKNVLNNLLKLLDKCQCTDHGMYILYVVSSKFSEHLAWRLQDCWWPACHWVWQPEENPGTWFWLGKGWKHALPDQRDSPQESVDCSPCHSVEKKGYSQPELIGNLCYWVTFLYSQNLKVFYCLLC